MQTSTGYKMDNLCRTCVQSYDIPLDSIFSKSNVSLLSLADMIMECTSVNISSTDELPKLICITCKEKLEISFSFKKQCHQSEQKLNEIFKVDFAITQIEFNSVDIKNEGIEDGEIFGVEDASLLDRDASLSTEETLKQHTQTNKRNKPSFKCNVCFKTWLSKKYFIRHIQQGHPTECDRCCLEFETFEMLTKHMKVHDADLSRFICHVCKKGYTRKPGLKQHILTVHPTEYSGKNDSKLDEENERHLYLLSTNCFDDNNEDSIRDDCINSTHFSETTTEVVDPGSETIDKNIKIEIDHSSRIFLSQENDALGCFVINNSRPSCWIENDANHHTDAEDSVNRHLNKVHSKHNFKCKECSVTFLSRQSYKKHLQQSHPSELLKCNYCEKLFMTDDMITRHMRVAHPDLIGNVKTYLFNSSTPLKQGDKFICRRCLLNLDSEELFAEHIKTHEQDERAFKCSECGQGFKKRSHLTFHLGIHANLKPNVCEICGKGFHQPGNLRAHLFIHTGEKPWKCKQCPAAFNQKSTLRSHLPCHSPVKFTCEYCGGKYARKKSLSNHIKSHLGLRVKIYPCSFCEKKFYSKDQLTKHTNIHTGEKLYACSICDKRFNRASQCKVHMRTHTGEKPYPCSVCQKAFAQKHLRDSHMIIHQTAN